MLKAEGFTKLKCTLPHQISRSDKGKEVIMFVVTFPTMINMCTKFHSNLRTPSVKMASPLGDLCWNDSHRLTQQSHRMLTQANTAKPSDANTAKPSDANTG